jgi:hypothetical protein
MKLVTSFGLLSAAILFNCCTKDSGTITSNSQHSLKVKSFTEEITIDSSQHYVSTSTLSYDAQERLIKLQSEKTVIDLAYETNLIRKSVYQAGLDDQHFYYYLNADTLLDSSILYNGSADAIYFYYLYNDKKQLANLITKRVYSWGNTVDTTAYEYNDGGDVSKIIQGAGINSYEYYDKPNFENSVSMLNPDITHNVHLLKKSSYSFMGYDVINTSYTYEYDDYGRVAALMRESIADFYSEAYKITYTYY